MDDGYYYSDPVFQMPHLLRMMREELHNEKGQHYFVVAEIVAVVAADDTVAAEVDDIEEVAEQTAAWSLVESACHCHRLRRQCYCRHALALALPPCSCSNAAAAETESERRKLEAEGHQRMQRRCSC